MFGVTGQGVGERRWHGTWSFGGGNGGYVHFYSLVVLRGVYTYNIRSFENRTSCFFFLLCKCHILLFLMKPLGLTSYTMVKLVALMSGDSSGQIGIPASQVLCLNTV